MVLEWISYFLFLFLRLTRPFCDVFLDVVYSIIMGRTKPLPPIDNNILLMPATELAEKIRKKQLKAEEVMRVYVDRIKKVNLLINAYIDERFEAAIADAKAVDRMLEKNAKSEEELKQQMPLLGVPFSCKEIVGIKGLAQTLALKRFKDRKAPMDGETAGLYRKAGAIPVVVTNIPTISMWWETSNPVFGLTRNPYDNRRTVGGSSGGEASLLTSAGSVIGIGTDIGGSIRIPASFCGIYGHKPSRGNISNHRTTPIVNTKVDPFLSTGPMCRYVQDLPLLVKILSGKNAKNLSLNTKVDFRKVKIFYMEGFPGLLSPISDIKEAVRKAANHFEIQYEVTATKITMEEMQFSFDIWQYKFVEVDSSPLLPDISDENGNFSMTWEFLKSLLHISEYDLPIIFFGAIRKRRKDKHYYKFLDIYRKLEKKLEDLLKGDSILLLPTHPEIPPHIKITLPKSKNTSYTSIFNILGYAATQIPAGFSRGLPIGIQAVAGICKDHLTLAAAVELDKVFGGWKSPCPVIM